MTPPPVATSILRTSRDIDVTLSEQCEGWTLIGGHAANIHRHEARATNDADVLASFGSEDLRESMNTLAAQLERNGWAA